MEPVGVAGEMVDVTRGGFCTRKCLEDAVMAAYRERKEKTPDVQVEGIIQPDKDFSKLKPN